MATMREMKTAITDRLLELQFPPAFVDDVAEMVICLTWETKMEMVAGTLMSALNGKNKTTVKGGDV